MEANVFTFLSFAHTCICIAVQIIKDPDPSNHIAMTLISKVVVFCFKRGEC